MLRFISILGVLVFFANIANAQNSPCYWSGSVVKCLPQTGIYLDKQKSLRLGDSGTTNYVELKGGSSITTHTLTLPTAQGAAGTAMINDGSGGLTWTAVPANPATSPILLADGSVSAPSLAFGSSGNTNTGLYLVGTDSMGFVANGVNIGQYSSAGVWTLGSSGSSAIHTINANRVKINSPSATSAEYRMDVNGTNYGDVGASGGTDQVILGSALGDMVYQAANTNMLFSANNGSTIQAKLTSGGVWTIGDPAVIGNNTFAGHKIVGVTNASTGAAGYVGEITVSRVTSGSAISVAASNTGYDITSIALTPGEWDISFTASTTGSTVVGGTYCHNWVGTSSGDTSAGVVLGDNDAATTAIPTSGNPITMSMANWQRNISGTPTTTYYLKVQCGFTTGTLTAYGRISARRVR